jgi:putative DNA primase/helicase
MWNNYNDKCEPPWEQEELLYKIQSITRSTKTPQGALDAKQAFASIPAVVYADPLAELEARKSAEWSSINRGGQQVNAPTLRNACNCFYAKEMRDAPHPEPDSPTVIVDNPLYRMIRYNEFANKIEFVKPAPWHDSHYPKQFWEDSDTLNARVWCIYNRHLDVPTIIMDDAALAVAHFYSYHPVRNWLNSLIWDGIKRLDTWLTSYCGATDTPYVQTVGKCTLIAAVARVFEPGCQHDSVLILEGEQGTGKTSAVRILGGKWYADIKIDPSNIDTIHSMCGKWILEASELEFLKRAEIQAIKRFITLTVDTGRLKFGRHSSDLPRQSVFIGTINPGPKPAYLSDTDGNRRYWPVATRTIRLRELQKDRDQIFAEATYRYRQREVWNLVDPKIILAANNEVMYRVDEDAWQERIAKWLDSDELPDLLDTTTVAFGALNLMARELDKFNKNRIARCMKNLGWELKRQRVKAIRQYVWEHSDMEGL